MLSNFIKFIFSLCLFGQVIQAMDSDKVTDFDLSKLRTQSTGNYDEEIRPYFEVRNRDQCNLVYVAAVHAFQKEGPVFKIIQHVMDTYKPTLVILEGFQDDHIESILSAPEKDNEGEPIFAMRLARKMGVRIMSGEPRDQDLVRRMHEQFRCENEKSEDVLAFYVLRLFYQECSRGNLAEFETLKDALNHIAVLEYGFLGENFGYDQVTKWAQQKGIEGFNNNFKAFCADHEALAQLWRKLFAYFGNIRSYDTFCRDQHILTRILANREQHPRIVVVYGEDHYQRQKDVLDEYFGKPIQDTPQFYNL